MYLYDQIWLNCDNRTTSDRIELFLDIMSEDCATCFPSNEKNNKWAFMNGDDLQGWLESIGYFDMPASTRFHGNWKGGLFDHSLLVARLLSQYTIDNNIVWNNERSPVFLGLFHDISKVHDYSFKYGKKTSSGKDVLEIVKNTEQYPLSGHGTKSALMMSEWTTLSEEEMLAIVHHHGAYNVDDWPQYDAAFRKYPSISMLHLADMVAAKVYKI